MIYYLTNKHISNENTLEVLESAIYSESAFRIGYIQRASSHVLYHSVEFGGVMLCVTKCDESDLARTGGTPFLSALGLVGRSEKEEG